MVKNLSTIQETWVLSLSQEDPLEKGMAIHSRVLPSDKEPACQRRRCRRCELEHWVGKIPWRREWQPTPVVLPRESNGQRSLEGYILWGFKEWDMTEHGCACARAHTHTHTHTHTLTLQYSCQENSMDRGTWQAMIHGIAKSQTWLGDSQTHKHNLSCPDGCYPQDGFNSQSLSDLRFPEWHTWWITAFLKQSLYFLNPAFS